jgi:hypothetical protein
MVSPAPSRVATAKLGIFVVALVVAAAVGGHVGPFKPTQKIAATASYSGMVRCEQLYTAWSHSDANGGADGRGANVRAATAMADCQRGDFAAGNAELERLLRYNGLYVPRQQTPEQTAAAR